LEQERRAAAMAVAQKRAGTAKQKQQRQAQLETEARESVETDFAGALERQEYKQFSVATMYDFISPLTHLS
jgi:hypothetical protein